MVWHFNVIFNHLCWYVFLNNCNSKCLFRKSSVISLFYSNQPFISYFFQNGVTRLSLDLSKGTLTERISTIDLLALTSLDQLHLIHRYRKFLNRLLKVCYVPATRAVLITFFSSFFAAAINNIKEANRAAGMCC